jgi:hypothetical protein
MSRHSRGPVTAPRLHIEAAGIDPALLGTKKRPVISTGLTFRPLQGCFRVVRARRHATCLADFRWRRRPKRRRSTALIKFCQSFYSNFSQNLSGTVVTTH